MRLEACAPAAAGQMHFAHSIHRRSILFCNARDRLFREFDIDHGGSISLDETVDALGRSYARYHVDHAIVQKAFYAADSTMDGVCRPPRPQPF